MEEAKSGCRKFRTGSIEFSVKAKMALLAARYWQMVIKKKKGKRVSTRALKVTGKIMTKSFKKDLAMVSLEEVHQILNAAKRQIKEW